MGFRGASFKLVQAGPLPANAGLVTEYYSNVAATVSCAGRDIATKTVWTGRLIEGDPAASSYSMLRPTTGDWPQGMLTVVGRQSWWDFGTNTTKLADEALATEEVKVTAAIEGAPPACGFVSAPTTIVFLSHPGGGNRQPETGIALSGVTDAHGPFVLIEVEYTIGHDQHVHRAQDIGGTRGGGGSVTLQGHQDEVQVQRVRVTNVLGKTLEILPPFPKGTAPTGPIGIKR